MSGFVLAAGFATGVALIWVGTVHQLELPRLLPPPPDLDLPVSAPLAALLTVALAGMAALTAWSATGVPLLAFLGSLAGLYAPFAWLARRRDRRQRDRERAWPAALTQLADGLAAGLAFPAALALVADAGPNPVRPDLRGLHTRLRHEGAEAALAPLAASPQRGARTTATLLRAGLIDMPTSGLAPTLRELAGFLGSRFEAREQARSRAASLRTEAGVLALSPVALMLLAEVAAPGYLDAYRTTDGTLVGGLGALAIGGCYLAMRRLSRVPEPAAWGGAR